jgi:hypothetical protein
LLVTENDYELGLYNGDTGVIIQSRADRVSAAFERRGEIIEYSPPRLGAMETVYAMTIHKSQARSSSPPQSSFLRRCRASLPGSCCTRRRPGRASA